MVLQEIEMIDPCDFWITFLAVSMTVAASITFLWLVVMFIWNKIEAKKIWNAERLRAENKRLKDELEQCKNS